MSQQLEEIKNSLRVVELEINSRCNRRCSYCPVSILPFPEVPNIMPENVLNRALEELQKIDYSERISYHFYNEPLLRTDLARIVKKTKEHLPKAKQILFTNGDLLTDERYKLLIEAGINFFVVTAHDNKVRTERPQQYVQYPKDLVLTNRGGILSHLPTVADEILKNPCYAPTEMLIVTATGDIVLCYEDAFRKTNYGNIVDKKIEDIWFNDELVDIRKNLIGGERTKGASICKKCTNKAHTKSGVSDKSEPFWKKVKM